MEDAVNNSETDSDPNNAPRGIISRTVFNSPIAKAIIPIALERKKNHALIFIYDNGFQIKEIAPDGTFSHRTCRSNLGGRVVAAAVFDTERAECLIQPRPTAPDVPDRLQNPSPRPILLLTLDTHELLFIHLDNAKLSEAYKPLLCSYRPLPAIQSFLGSPGPFIAVDESTGAIAVAARQRTVVLYKTDLEAFPQHPPVLEEALIDVEGTVVAMEFLRGPRDDPATVILALIVFRTSHSYLHICSWSTHASLEKRKITTSSHRLGIEHGMPTLLVPLRPSGSLMLVCDRAIAIYDNVLSGSLQQICCRPLEKLYHDDPASFASSKRLPVYCNWARPGRNWGLNVSSPLPHWQGVEDALYLAREDGLVLYLSVRRTGVGNLDISSVSSAGHLPEGANIAFAVLNDLEGPDVLIAAGGFAEGGSYEFGTHYKPWASLEANPSRREAAQARKKDATINWAPFTDVALKPSLQQNNDANLSQMIRGSSLYGLNRSILQDRLFATSGRAPDGAVSEIQQGYEVRISTIVGLADETGVNGIWVLRSSANRVGQSRHDRSIPTGSSGPDSPTSGPESGDLYAISFHSHTMLYHLQHDSVEAIALDDDSTLALTLLDKRPNIENLSLDEAQNIVRVTPSKIQLLRLVAGQSDVTVLHTWTFNAIAAASVHPLRWTVILTMMVAEGSVVAIKQLSLQNDSFELVQARPEARFPFEISVVALFNISNGSAASESQSSSSRDPSNADKEVHLAVLGGLDGSIRLCDVDDLECNWRTFEWSSPYAQEDQLEICDSVAVVSGTSSDPLETVNAIMLFGLRSGSMRTLTMSWNEKIKNIHVLKQASYLFGATSVRLTSDKSSNHDAVYVFCGSLVCHVDFGRDALSEPRIHRVLFADRADRTFKHGLFDALCSVEGSYQDISNYGNLVAVSGSNLLRGYLEAVEKPLPRRIPVPGTPNRVIYSRYLEKFLVPSTITAVDYRLKTRFTIGAIFVLDPDQPTISPDSDEDGEDEDGEDGEHFASTPPSFVCSPGEKITGVIEWYFTLGGEIHHLLILAITNDQPTRKNKTGSLKYLKASRDGDAGVKITLYKESRETAPVYAICSYGRDSLLYSCGRNLRIRTYSPEERRFNKRSLYDLPSPAVYISAQEPFVHVTTSQHSLMVFKFVNDELELISTDNGLRNGTAHLDLPSLNLVLMATKDSSVVAFQTLDHPSSKLATKATSPLFEARLSSSVTRFCNGSLALPYKPVDAAGILEKNIIATGADGSMYALTIVAESVWRLLRFIQDMCMRCDELRSLTSSGLSKPSPSKARLEHPTSFQLNGDILARLADYPSAKRLLLDLLKGEFPTSNNHEVSGTDTRIQFRQLVQNVSALRIDATVGEKAKMEETDAVDFALSYIRIATELPF